MMKNPYAPGFWCAIAALALLSVTYFYGIVVAQQLDRALVFLDSVSALIAVLVIVVFACIALEEQQLRKKHLNQGKTRVMIWDTKVALRRVETVFDRYFWGGYWQPGRTFQEVMGELTGTPLEKSLEALKTQCRKLDKELIHSERRWLSNARELADVAKAMACERHQLDFCDLRSESPNASVINRDFEVLVYTWTARLKSFDHQLDVMETEYS